MKNKIILMLIMSASTMCKLNAQSLSLDVNYLKAINCLWSAVVSFERIKSSDNQIKEKGNALPTIKISIDKAKKYYTIIKDKYPNDKDFKKFESWILVMGKSYESLNSDDWDTNPTWQMGNYLTELDLIDVIKTKL